MTLQSSCINLSPDMRLYKVSTSDSAVTTFDLMSLAVCVLLLIFYTNNLNIWLLVSSCILLRYWTIRGKVQEGGGVVFFFLFCKEIHASFVYFILSESLLLIRELGVQITKKHWNGKETHTFIEKSRISDVIINEGIQRFNIFFYMAFVVEGNAKMILAFEVWTLFLFFFFFFFCTIDCAVH
jgi:hypothetical protein